MIVNLVEGTHLLKHAQVHDGDALGHGDGFKLVVCHQHGGAPGLGVQTLELDTHMRSLRRIQMRERLVHQEHIRIAHQRPRQRNALLLPAAQFGWFAVEDVADLQHVRHFTDALLDFGVGRSWRPQAEGDVVVNGQRRVQRIGFKGQRHVALVGFQLVDQRLPM